MQFIRSILFTIVFYLFTILMLLCIIPSFVLPRTVLICIARWWAGISCILLRMCTGIKSEFRHLERIPKGVPLLVASKHQSFWETFAFFLIFEKPTFILKRELLWIPFFGWYLKKLGAIPINRSEGDKAIRSMLTKAKEALAEGRQIIIFPEGTRHPPGAPPDYKRGISLLYRMLNLPCLPIALNSGVYWPRRKLIKNPGTIVVDICPILPAGLSRDEFLFQLETAIETASNRLL